MIEKMTCEQLCAEVANLIAAEMYTDDFNIKLNQWLTRYWRFDGTVPCDQIAIIDDDTGKVELAPAIESWW